MLLRSLTTHVKDQNWTAVGIDFFIVVVGVFIGIQVANWNEARLEKVQEAAILDQLADEFSEIQTALIKQIKFREGYAEDLRQLVVGLEAAEPSLSDQTVKRALVSARSTGRRPAKSAAYLQLTASGQLARLSNEELKNKLIRYHTLLERDAFIFPELMGLVVEESSSNKAVDFDVTAFAEAGAAVDYKGDEAQQNLNAIRGYDLKRLKEHEERYELLHLLHRSLVGTEKNQLKLVEEILADVSVERHSID